MGNRRRALLKQMQTCMEIDKKKNKNKACTTLTSLKVLFGITAFIIQYSLNYLSARFLIFF